MAKKRNQDSGKETPLSSGKRQDERKKRRISIPLHAGAEPRQFKHARELRQEMTEAEKVLWDYFRARRFMDLKFRRQHPLLKFIADFYCHELKLIVEVDGGYHGDDDVQYYDEERTKELQRYGYSVIRFTSDEVLGDIEGVLNELKNKVNALKSISPQPLSSSSEERGKGRGRKEKM